MGSRVYYTGMQAFFTLKISIIFMIVWDLQGALNAMRENENWFFMSSKYILSLLFLLMWWHDLFAFSVSSCVWCHWKVLSNVVFKFFCTKIVSKKIP